MNVFSKFNFLFQEELEDKKKDWLIRLVQTNQIS
jgi:hypothetical protein